MKRDKSEPREIRSQPDFSRRPSLDENAKVVYDRLTSFDYMVGQKECAQCKDVLEDCPVVLCARCDAVYCLPCFLTNSDTSSHRRYHDYYILDRLSFPVFSPGWTAREELMLVQGVSTAGVDNWAEIANTIGSKTPQECEAHYYSFYYKSSSDKAPNPDEIIAQRMSNGRLRVDEVRAEAARRKEEAYMKMRSQLFSDEEVKREEDPASKELRAHAHKCTYTPG